MAITINGTTGITGADDAIIKLGSSNDLQIQHNGTDSVIQETVNNRRFLLAGDDIRLRKGDQSEDLAQFKADAECQLFHNGSLRFETTQYGAKITSGTNDNGKLEFKSGNHDYSCIGYTGLNRFAIDGHDGLEVRDPSDSYATRMKIGSDGKLHAFGNVASENAQLFQNISSTNPEGLYLSFPNAAPNTSSRHFLKASDSSATRIVIDSNGNLRNENNSYGAISDVSLKENIVDASSQWNDIKNVKVRVFNFKTDNASDKRIGVVAQEIETVCPKLVDISYDKDAEGNLLETGVKSVKYSVLYMKAIKALQEAMTKIETLETKVAALEAA